MTSDQGQGDPRMEPRFDGGGRSFDVDPYDRPAANPRRTARRRLLAVVVALVAFGGFAGIAWYATSQGQKDPSAVVPVLTAENEPVKERPLEPGGLQVPNRDVQVYNRMTPSAQPQKVEQLLPPPETPVARPVPEPMPQASTAAPDAPAIQGRAAGQVPPAPKQGQEVGVAPVTPPTVPPAPKAEAPAPKMTAPAESAPKKAAPKQTAAVAPGSWRVQLGASKEEARARSSLARIIKSNSDLLGSQPSEVVRADLGAKGVFWRMRAGSFADRASADALCKKLAARKVACSVVKP